MGDSYLPFIPGDTKGLGAHGPWAGFIACWRSRPHTQLSACPARTPQKNKRLGDDLLHLRINQEFPHISLLYVPAWKESKQVKQSPWLGSSQRRGYSLPAFEIPFFLFQHPRALEAKDNPEFSKEIHWNKSHSSLLSFLFFFQSFCVVNSVGLGIF